MTKLPLNNFANRFRLPEIHWGWLVLLAGALALLLESSAVIGPFLAGFILAYLLDPLAAKLQRWGVPRAAATLIVLAGFVALLVGLVWAIAPIVQDQLGQLITALPGLIHEWQPVVQNWLRRAGQASSQTTLVSDFSKRILEWASGSIGGLLSQTLAFVNLIGLVVVAPIVAFYLLRDWALMTRSIDNWWPRGHVDTVRALLAEADAALSGFIRGQLLVCCAIGTLYATGWSLIGLNYALVLGLMAGVLSFVPYLGSLVAVSLSLLIAVGQFGFDPIKLALVVAVFLGVQVAESSVLVPNLIGNRIGLHPVWVLFAILAGGQIAGIAGVFLAVPVAAVLGVLVRWSMQRYFISEFYNGASPP